MRSPLCLNSDFRFWDIKKIYSYEVCHSTPGWRNAGIKTPFRVLMVQEYQMEEMMKDYYAILGVSSDSPPDEIKKAFYDMVKLHHPDKGGNAERMKEVNEAHSVLSDPSSKELYDLDYQAYFNKSSRRQNMNGGNGELVKQNPLGSFYQMEKFTSLYNLKDRNAEAKRIITEYAIKHATMDVSIGIVGSWIPGAPLIFTAGSVLAATKVIYKPMVEKLGSVYSASPDHITDQYISDATIMTAIGDFAAQFGAEFLAEIAREIMNEVGIGMIPTFIPGISSIAGPLLDVIIAVTITWRIGTMTSLYFQNGESWIGDRKTTFEHAKDITKIYLPNLYKIVTEAIKELSNGGNMQSIKLKTLNTISEDVSKKVDLNDLPDEVPQIRKKQIDAIKPIIESFKKSGMDFQKIKEILLATGIDEKLLRLSWQQL